MALRRPLVMVNGQMQQIPSGDQIAGDTYNAGGSVAPADKTLTYYPDGKLHTITDTYGTKTLAYNGDGTLHTITGTGSYASKQFNWTAGKLTSITII